MPPTTGGKVKLGGKRRTLRFTFEALEKAADVRDGEPLVHTMDAVGALSFPAIKVMVWAGLLHEEPALVLDDVAGMIEPPLKPVIDALIEALEPWVEIIAEADGEGKPD
ncbi:MAG TPA: hypothetical protein VK966_02690 [Longimicrobiales bacterium]|nr:hypothetical protein [Longimicrobiales bacterium]